MLLVEFNTIIGSWLMLRIKQNKSQEQWKLLDAVEFKNCILKTKSSKSDWFINLVRIYREQNNNKSLHVRTVNELSERNE